MVLARRYVELLEKEVASQAGTTRSRDASVARERLQRVTEQLAVYDESLATWASRATGFPGSVAVSLGLAAPAP